MEWANQFYSKMFSWAESETTGIFNDLREDLVDKLEVYVDQPIEHILELGAGSGQFAVAAAKRGYKVTVIELVPKAINLMKKLASEHGVENNLHIIEGNFYKVDVQGPFDVVCYWDGFGIGSDEDQQRLLNRVSQWLKSDGMALIDIYTPWYWAKVAGEEMKLGHIARRYNFDPVGCKMVDTWWHKNEPESKVTQYLRCYSPADLNLLLKESDLHLDKIQVGGEMDYESREFIPETILERAMSYLAKLVKP
ncbi:cyclopropane-fatty-acyl-phospholipid synthase family protein [Pontibacillus sp. HMF3514]|uniref:SAM-dependent methyltransferase n=1 Tax=Pontibacillus sp. HMF3514 TaxID=2692425 RepID=UPI0013203866|nr:class I SAM-dependent methyltransferase [Pontibacillus sp. HMF3514]QHE50989.1 methyltransferase domain-containing protein [Pontibacillus sp. HMF3514]